MKDQLESLVGMMVERGILLEEAVTEFEKKFIKRVLERSEWQSIPRRESPRNSPQHAEPQSGRVQAGPAQAPSHLVIFSRDSQ